jgi:hypothetical protein
MVSAASSPNAAERVSYSRLLWVGPLTIVAAVLANAVLRLVAVALLQPDPSFMPLTPMIPIVFTIAGALGAVIAYAIIGRTSRQPILLFRRVALIVLLLSFIPDVLLLLSGTMPGATVATVGVLMMMHVVAWAICVRLLTTLARE